MQAYKGKRNGHALSHSTDLSKMFPLWSKAYSKKIKHCVRQEGRQDIVEELSVPVNINYLLEEEISYLKQEDMYRTVAYLMKIEFDGKCDYKKICLAEEKRILDTYGYDWDTEYMMYHCGLANRFYNAHDDYYTFD